jgi:hypothetical protein
MSIVEPQPNPETVAVLLDTTWRVASAESGRTDSLDRKAATVATFASVVAVLTATLGVRLVDVDRHPAWWTLALFIGGLTALVGAVGFSLQALRPKEYVGLGVEYVKRFPTWSEILKPPEQVRGETMRTLVQSIARERTTNDGKVASIHRSFSLLLIGLVLVAGEGATLVIKDAIG